jgi:ribosomal protein S18 acetylase RimI-like enzyme
MIFMELEVRPAGAEDVDTVVDILSEAARWVIAKGFRQWPFPFPRHVVEEAVGRRELFVGEQAGEVVGTLTFQEEDVLFWGKQAPVACYVHRLAVRRDRAGRGIGERLLAWAEREAAARGRRYLRLDCVAVNERMRAYYEELGFEPRGERVFDDGFAAALYERPVR